MSNLIVEIGNTALKAAWADGVTLGKIYRYQGERKTDFILDVTKKQKADVMIIASVFTISESDVRKLKNECGTLIVLDPSQKDFLHRYNIPEYLSYDRAASLMAARYLYKGKGCTVIDFGTTLTTDFISPEGNYEGGSISPGCRTRFKSLNRYARVLPLVDTPETIAEKGTSIVSSIETGVIKGIMFEICGYIAEKPDNVVIFTGGDANYFVTKLKKPIFVVCNLVLLGLALFIEDYVQKIS